MTSEEAVDVVGDWVVTRQHWEVRGGASGIEMQMDISGAYRLDDGECVEVRFSWDHDEALAAARGSR